MIGDGPNLCRVKISDVSSTFIENIFRSGLTLVSSNDIITIKIDEIFFLNCQTLQIFEDFVSPLNHQRIKYIFKSYIYENITQSCHKETIYVNVLSLMFFNSFNLKKDRI